MKHSLIIALCALAALSVSADRQVYSGASVNHGECLMILGDPVAGISGSTDSHHATCGQLQGTLDVEDITAVAGTIATLSWKIYPNPTSAILFIDRDNEDDAAATFISLDGKKMLEAALRESHSSIDLSTLPIGIYLLTISDSLGNPTVTAKIIKR